MSVKLLELFCGTKSISKVAELEGIETFTSDINKTFKPDYKVNIRNFDVNKVPFKPHVIWASIPCTYFSVASAWRHWNKDGSPGFWAKQGLEDVKLTLELINYFNPIFWYIENPRGKLRKQKIMRGLPRFSLSYCKYGDNRCKPTDIWTNNVYWKPKLPCKPFEPVHVSGDTRTTRAQKGVIPEMLCKEIIKSTIDNL